MARAPVPAIVAASEEESTANPFSKRVSKITGSMKSIRTISAYDGQYGATITTRSPVLQEARSAERIAALAPAAINTS